MILQIENPPGLSHPAIEGGAYCRGEVEFHSHPDRQIIIHSRHRQCQTLSGQARLRVRHRGIVSEAGKESTAAATNRSARAFSKRSRLFSALAAEFTAMARHQHAASAHGSYSAKASRSQVAARTLNPILNRQDAKNARRTDRFPSAPPLCLGAFVQAYRIVVSAKMLLFRASVPSTSLRAGPSTSLRAGPSTSLRAGSEAAGVIVPRTSTKDNGEGEAGSAPR